MTQNHPSGSAHSASSANDPYGATSSGGDAGAVAGSPYGSPGQSQSGQAYGSHPGASGSPSLGAPAGSPAGARTGAAKSEVGFFRAMFDFRFQHFITISFSSFLYVIAWVVAVLLWGWDIVIGIFFGFAFGGLNYFSDSSFTPWPLILAILFGWIPSVIAIIAMRLGLEFSVAVVRTAQNTGTLADKASEASTR